MTSFETSHPENSTNITSSQKVKPLGSRHDLFLNKRKVLDKSEYNTAKSMTNVDNTESEDFRDSVN